MWKKNLNPSTPRRVPEHCTCTEECACALKARNIVCFAASGDGAAMRTRQPPGGAGGAAGCARYEDGAAQATSSRRVDVTERAATATTAHR